MLERRGNGPLPATVLLHGLSSAGVHYLGVTPYLKALSRVALPDLPGHGFSQMPKRLDGATLLLGITEALDALIDEPVVLAGTSLGGYVAIRYALMRPEKVAGLLVASPAGALMTEAELAELRARFALGSHREAVEFVDALFAERHPYRQVVALGLRRYFTLPQTLAVLREMDVAKLFVAEELASLKMPMRVLWGDCERILPGANLQWFKAHLPPQARLEQPPGWGHSGFLDDPRGFALRLLHFAGELAGVSAAQVERLLNHGLKRERWRADSRR